MTKIIRLFDGPDHFDAVEICARAFYEAGEHGLGWPDQAWEDLSDEYRRACRYRMTHALHTLYDHLLDERSA